MLESAEADKTEELVRFGVSVRPGPCHLEWQAHIPDDIEPGEQYRVLEDDAKLPLVSRSRRGRAVDTDLATRRFVEIGDEPQERRLSAPARADEGDELPDPDVEAYVRQRRERSAIQGERLADVSDRDGARV